MHNKAIVDFPKIDLSIEAIRNIPDFSNFNDEKLETIIECIKELSFLLYSIETE